MTHRIVFVTTILAFSAGFALADSAPIPALNKEETYNEGVGLYRDQQWNLAAEKFRQSSQSEKQELAARSRYNLGNCHYAAALQLVQRGGKPDEVTPFVRDAIDSYRSALRIDPNDHDARANLELAVRALDALTKPEEQNRSEEEDKPEEENKSDQPQEEKPNSDNSDPQNQDNEQEQSQDQKDQQEPSESDQANKPESADDQQSKSPPEAPAGDQEQKEQDGSDSEAPTNDQQSDGSDASNESQPQPSPSQDSTKPSDETMPDQSSDPPDTETPDTEKTDSSGKLESDNQQPDETDRPIASESGIAEADDGKLMTQQEAMKMLQAIRDRDLLRRYQHERSERSRYVPVERDW